MVKVILERLESTDEGTFGRIVLGGHSFFTGELPWRDNAPNISCIPLGNYVWSVTHSARFNRPLYLARDVDGRTGVRIHSANYMGDLLRGYRSELAGCVSLGKKLGWIKGQKALLLSATAVREFTELLEGKPFHMEIVNG